MESQTKAKVYDLEERTYLFAKDVRAFIKRLPKTISHVEDCRQLNNSSGSVGANYIEANEALSRKDFRMRTKISRKEAKESRYWLRLLDMEGNSGLEAERAGLIQKSTELLKILSAILQKSE